VQQVDLWFVCVCLCECAACGSSLEKFLGREYASGGFVLCVCVCLCVLRVGQFGAGLGE